METTEEAADGEDIPSTTSCVTQREAPPTPIPGASMSPLCDGKGFPQPALSKHYLDVRYCCGHSAANCMDTYVLLYRPFPPCIPAFKSAGQLIRHQQTRQNPVSVRPESLLF